MHKHFTFDILMISQIFIFSEPFDQNTLRGYERIPLHGKGLCTERGTRRGPFSRGIAWIMRGRALHSTVRAVLNDENYILQ
jgi:hypothetical protein